MHRKKIENFIKGYFYFSQSERRGIIALVILLLMVMAIPSVYRIISPQQLLEIKITALTGISGYNDSTSGGEAEHARFPFDPNTATQQELKQLGFSERNISTLHKYLNKGGKIRQSADLKKMYGVNPQLISELMPYIVIQGKEERGGEIRIDTNYSRRKYNIGPLDLNIADSSQLTALYRIGPAMAKRIIEYRTKLGGFISLEQLKEIWGFDEDILYDLKGRIYVDAGKAIIHDVNTVTLEELKMHPYFKYKLSNAIVNYRSHHGPYQALGDLKKIVIINDSIYTNITRYLKIQ